MSVIPFLRGHGLDGKGMNDIYRQSTPYWYRAVLDATAISLVQASLSSLLQSNLSDAQ